ncbi:MAG: alanine dehydrogenase, alanine dehydrogenase [archaeon GW2011_AR3]|nr:MAG: alanine dehydrogenase, alanine dehydrogenase [archaeon GW2011_AR3]
MPGFLFNHEGTMRIGVIKEIKDNENRVGLSPEGAARLVAENHEVLVQGSAGEGSGFSDEDYEKAGARIATADEAWSSDIIVKVKEPMNSEYKFFRDGLVIYTYFHLAGVDHGLSNHLLEKKVTAVAYETVEDHNGKLPLLAPMSSVAGRVAVQTAAYYLAKFNNGSGKLIGGVPGVDPATVVIIGGGVVGYNAAQIAIGMGAETILLDVSDEKLYHLKHSLQGKPHILISNRHNISEAVKKADILVGAVLLAGAKAPFLVTEEMVKSMRPGSVIVDVAIDQGGCIETMKPTSHSHPVFMKHGVIHYGVTNMPGAFPRTATQALTHATLPYLLKIAKHGLAETARHDPGFAKGINTYRGYFTCKPVAESLGQMDKFMELKDLLE